MGIFLVQIGNLLYIFIFGNYVVVSSSFVNFLSNFSKSKGIFKGTSAQLGLSRFSPKQSDYEKWKALLLNSQNYKGMGIIEITFDLIKSLPNKRLIWKLSIFLHLGSVWINDFVEEKEKKRRKLMNSMVQI